jgi:hypothetical protein
LSWIYILSRFSDAMLGGIFVLCKCCAKNVQIECKVLGDWFICLVNGIFVS